MRFDTSRAKGGERSDAMVRESARGAKLLRGASQSEVQEEKVDELARWKSGLRRVVRAVPERRLGTRYHD